MRCPACSFPALEQDAACRSCDFSIEVADKHYGLPPMLSRPVADTAQVLSPKDERRIGDEVRELERRFPQLSVAVVTTQAPAHVPLPVHAFWLFNRASLFSAVEKEGNNHGVLLLLDTGGHQMLLMPGYGLEPFVPEAALATCLHAATPAFHDGQYADSVVTCLRELGQQLEKIVVTLPKIFGYNEEIVGATAGDGDDEDLY